MPPTGSFQLTRSPSRRQGLVANLDEHEAEALDGRQQHELRLPTDIYPLGAAVHVPLNTASGRSFCTPGLGRRVTSDAGPRD